MARLERYSDEEVAVLKQIVKDNAAQAKPLAVAELAAAAEKKMPGRSADALKQRIFKMLREARSMRRPTKKVAQKIPKPKATVRVAAKKKGRIVKDPPRTRVPARKAPPQGGLESAAVHIPTPVAAPEGVVLHLPNGARVQGSPAQIAEIARSL